MAPWLKWVIGIVVAIIVLFTILIFANRAFRHKYGFSLYGGGFLMLLGVAACVGGVLMIMAEMKLGYALFIITAITVIVTLVYDFKKCGGAGILAFILQILFCLPCVLVIFDVLFNRGRSTLQQSIDEDVYERRRARRQKRRNGGNNW